MTLNEREALENRLGWLAVRVRARHEHQERPAEADCPICGKVVTGMKMHRDHDHKTGLFRAYLCRDCNLGLGRFKDSPVLLRRAAEYLEIMVEVEPMPEPLHEVSEVFAL